MNDDLHDQVLDAYFWHFVDRGDAPADRRFTENCAGDWLARVIARKFCLSSHEAESAVELARKEVAL